MGEADSAGVEVPRLPNAPSGPRPTGLFNRPKQSSHRRLSSSENDGGHQPSCRRDVLDILVALEGYGVHIVYAGAGDGEMPVGIALGAHETDVEVLPDTFGIPEETEAVLILADSQFPHAGAHLLYELKTKMTLAIPVVAMILQGQTQQKDLSVIVCATGVLAMAPVDDVLLQPTCKDDLPLMLALVMEKVERRAKALQLEALAASGPGRQQLQQQQQQLQQQQQQQYQEQRSMVPHPQEQVLQGSPPRQPQMPQPGSPSSQMHPDPHQQPPQRPPYRRTPAEGDSSWSPGSSSSSGINTGLMSDGSHMRGAVNRSDGKFVRPTRSGSDGGGGSPSSPTSRGELTPSAEQQTKDSRPSRRSVDGGSSPSSPSNTGSSSGSREAKQEQRKHSHNQASMWDECRLLRRLRHNNIVGVQDVVDAQLSRPLKGSGAPNLRRAIVGAGGQLEVHRAQVIFCQIASGVAYCHEMRIAHRNLKPESIMVSDTDQVKVANFALAVKLNNPCRDKCGTMPFVAPEILASKPYDASASDVWSMGVILLEMLCGINKLPRLLNWGSTSSPSSERARDLEAFFGCPKAMLQSVQDDLGISDPELEDLLTGLINIVPEHRWSAERSRDCPWASHGASNVPEPVEAPTNAFSSQLQEKEEENDETIDSAVQNGCTGGTSPTSQEA